VKRSDPSFRQYRINTLIITISFITITHIGVYFLRETPWYLVISTWIISCLGAYVLIHLSFQRVEILQDKLQEKLTESINNSLRQTALASLSGGFTTALNKEEICNALAQRLHDVKGYEYVAVYLLDKTTNHRLLTASIGGLGFPDAITLPPGKGLSEQPILTGKLQYTPDISNSSQYIPGLGQGSEVDVPIRFNQEILGVLVVENREINAFAPYDLELLTSAADQAAIAIQNTHSLAVEIVRRNEAEVLRNATMAVSSELDLDQVLDHILTQLSQVVPFDSSCVFIWQGEYLHAKAARGLPDPDQVIGKFFPADNELFNLIRNTGQPIILDDIRKDSRFQGWGGTSRMLSWMGIPLKVGQEIIGYLTLDHLKAHAYTQEDADLALIFAHQAAAALQNAQLYQDAKNAAAKLIVLHEANQIITRASFDPERTYATIHEAAEKLMPCEAFSISILDEVNNEIEAVYLYDRDGQAPSVRIPANKGLSGYIISTGTPLLMQDLLEPGKLKDIDVIHFGYPDHIRAFIAVPMRLGNKVIGMLSSQSYSPHKYSIQDQHMLEMLASHAAIAINNAQLFAQVQRLAITDSLTNIYNRRYFFEAAQVEFSRANRYEHPFSIIMIDLDNYKTINDTYGHVIGDEALKLISQRLLENIRGSDILARYGGDEFSVLLPETDLPQAVEMAERLRILVSEAPIVVDQYQFNITISIGVTSSNEHVTDLSQIILSADMALYDAKSGERNKVAYHQWPLDNYPRNNA